MSCCCDRISGGRHSAPVSPRSGGRRPSNPVVQALTLTDVVVGATVTAFCSPSSCRSTSGRTLDPARLSELQGSCHQPAGAAPVAVPLLGAALLVALHVVARRRLADVVASGVAAAVAVMCLFC